MAVNVKTPKGKFSVPFKSPAASQTVSQPTSQATSQASYRSSVFPDDGLDDSLLWYPENYSQSVKTQNSKKTDKAGNTDLVSTKEKQKKPSTTVPKKMQPKKFAAKPKRKAPVKENVMPQMPRTPKTPTKIARIIPKTPTKKSTQKDLPKTPDKKAVPLTPRTPTFQLYGIKSPFSKSQQSTPGLTQNTLLKKLSSLNKSANNARQLQKQDAGVTVVENDIQESTGIKVTCNQMESNENPSETAEIDADNIDTNLTLKSHIYEEARKYVEGQDIVSGQATKSCTLEEARLYVISQKQQRMRNQEPAVQKDVYNFRMSPNSQKIQRMKNRRAAREKRIKEELLELIARTAVELRDLRQRREKLHHRQQGREANATMLGKRIHQEHLLMTSPLVQ